MKRKLLQLMTLATLLAPMSLPTVSIFAQDNTDAAVSDFDTTPSGSDDWVQIYETGNHNFAKFGELNPEVAQAFGALGGVALADGEVSALDKELIAVALSVEAQCTKCISSHVINALKLGATRNQIAEVVGVNILMGGGPTSVYAGKAIDAFDVLSVDYAEEIEAAQAEISDAEDSITETESEIEATEYDTEASGSDDWVEIYETGNHNFAKFAELNPEVAEAFGAFGAAALADGEVSALTKEMIAVALSVSSQCTKCISSHVINFINLGGTREQLAEIVGVNILMGGGPTSVYAGKAIDAFDVLLPAYGTQVEDQDNEESVEDESTEEDIVEEETSVEVTDEEETTEENN